MNSQSIAIKGGPTQLNFPPNFWALFMVYIRSRERPKDDEISINSQKRCDIMLHALDVLESILEGQDKDEFLQLPGGSQRLRDLCAMFESEKESGLFKHDDTHGVFACHLRTSLKWDPKNLQSNKSAKETALQLKNQFLYWKHICDTSPRANERQLSPSLVWIQNHWLHVKGKFEMIDILNNNSWPYSPLGPPRFAINQWPILQQPNPTQPWLNALLQPPPLHTGFLHAPGAGSVQQTINLNIYQSNYPHVSAAHGSSSSSFAAQPSRTDYSISNNSTRVPIQPGPAVVHADSRTPAAVKAMAIKSPTSNLSVAGTKETNAATRPPETSEAYGIRTDTPLDSNSTYPEVALPYAYPLLVESSCPPLPPPDLPKDCVAADWSYYGGDPQGKIIICDFSKFARGATIPKPTERFILKLLQRHDLCLTLKSVLNMNLKDFYNSLHSELMMSSDDEWKLFRVFEKTSLDDGTVVWAEKLESVSARAKDFVEYSEKLDLNLPNATMVYRLNGSPMTLDSSKESIYMLDIPISQMPKLYSKFQQEFLLNNLLPGNSWCMTRATHADHRPAYGPLMFMTQDGSFSFTHCDGANTTDSWNISLPAVFPPGRDISNYYVGHNYVVLVLRLYTEEDFHLAAGILSGFPCHVPAHKPACMTRGQQILAQAPHDAEEDTQLRLNALPTPEILAWMKHWGFEVRAFLQEPDMAVHIPKGAMHNFTKLTVDDINRLLRLMERWDEWDAISPGVQQRLLPLECHLKKLSALAQTAPPSALRQNFGTVAGDWYNPGVDGTATNGEFAYSHVAAARTWFSSLIPLTTGEYFMYVTARMAFSRDPPPDSIILGILPLLQFCIQRDKRHIQKILNSRANIQPTPPETIDCMYDIPLEDEDQFDSNLYKATVKYANLADWEDHEISPHAFGEWSCSHCHRDIGNVYLRCRKCFAAIGLEIHYVCTDCFLAGRHYNTCAKKWPNSDRAHTHTTKRPIYDLRFRLLRLDGLSDLIRLCQAQLNSSQLQELPESSATIQHLSKAHSALEAYHLIPSKACPVSTTKIPKKAAAKNQQKFTPKKAAPKNKKKPAPQKRNN